MKTLLAGLISTVFLIASSVLIADNSLLDKQFNDLDKDGDGVISRHEVQSQQRYVRFMNLYYSNSFSQADVNSDGILDREEFFAYEEDIPVE